MHQYEQHTQISFEIEKLVAQWFPSNRQSRYSLNICLWQTCLKVVNILLCINGMFGSICAIFEIPRRWPQIRGLHWHRLHWRGLMEALNRTLRRDCLYVTVSQHDEGLFGMPRGAERKQVDRSLPELALEEGLDGCLRSMGQWIRLLVGRGC